MSRQGLRNARLPHKYRAEIPLQSNTRTDPNTRMQGWNIVSLSAQNASQVNKRTVLDAIVPCPQRTRPRYVSTATVTKSPGRDGAPMRPKKLIP